MATAELLSALKEREQTLQHLREECSRLEEEIKILSAAARLLERTSPSTSGAKSEPVLVQASSGSGDIRKAFP